MALFIPNKIKVGYQERSSTYSGKLAYVIYYDAQGKIHKEASWNTWRDKKIPFDEFENEPLEGFVLNKKAGGTRSHWDTRQTYTRVYDPRGFEIEITIPNLLHILESTDCIRGKGLVGTFVYAWDGKDLVLLSTQSADYDDLVQKTQTLMEDNYIRGSELKVGRTYSTIDGYTYTFMGKHPEVKYDDSIISHYHPLTADIQLLKSGVKAYTLSKPKFWFVDHNGYVQTRTSVSRFLYSCVDDNVHQDYQSFVDKLESDCDFSPINYTDVESSNMTLDDIKKKFASSHGWAKRLVYFNATKNKFCELLFEDDHTIKGNYKHWGTFQDDGIPYGSPWFRKSATIEEIFKEFKPCKVKVFLQSGKLYKEY